MPTGTKIMTGDTEQAKLVFRLTSFSFGGRLSALRTTQKRWRFAS